MLKEKLNSKLVKELKDSNTGEVYDAVLNLTQDEMDKVEHVHGDRKLYYISAEFLIGKLLTINS